MAKAVWTEVDVDDAIARIASGESPSSIAASYGRQRSSLYKRLKRRGVDMPKAGWNRTLWLPESATDLAYIAGIVDGEGSLQHVQGKWWHMKIGMTDEPLMAWLASFGGTLDYEARANMPNRKPYWIWVVARRRDVEVLLVALMPYLRVKRELAERALKELQA